MTRQPSLVGALAISLMMLFSVASGAPRLILEESEFDFGYVPQNALISHIFWLKSAGDDSLKILNVIPGCGCTKAPLEDSELAVGDSTRLEILFSTGHYSSRVTKSPRIETNEGPPHKSVRIVANVVTRPDSTYPITFKPYKLDISQFGEKVRDEMRFEITNVSEQNLEIGLVDRPEGLFSLELPSTLGAGQTATVVLRLHADAVETSFEKSITIELNDQQSSRFTIPVKRTLRLPGETTTTAGIKGE